MGRRMVRVYGLKLGAEVAGAWLAAVEGAGHRPPRSWCDAAASVILAHTAGDTP